MKTVTSMCTLVGLLVSVVAATGCRKLDDGDEFRGGVPTRETVALHVAGAPADGAGPGAGATGALLAQKSDMYSVTRAVTGIVNGGTWAVLTLVKTIVAFPPTTVDKKAQTAVWGPHTDPLSPNTWRLTVDRLEAHKFQWLLEARPKTPADSAFMTIISGTHTADVDAQGDHVEGFGSGTFTIDWDNAAKLPEHDDNVGKTAFTYSRLLADGVVHVDVDFTGIEERNLRGGPTPELFNAVYRYVETPGSGGDLRYAEDKDNFPEPGNTGSKKEHFTFHSRWLEDGTGRSDLSNAGGDLTTTAGQASECWDTNFKSVFLSQAWDPTGGWGAESACTAFPTAVYAGL
jgi:hypothetical protein